MNTLPVPDNPQIGPGADVHRNDCGVGGLDLLQAYKLALGMTVDDFYDACAPSGDLGLDQVQIRAELTRMGLPTTWRTSLSMHDVFDFLTSKRPLLALIHYAPLVDAHLTQFLNFRAGHWAVLVGFDINGVAILDPDHSDGKGLVEVPYPIWTEAWSQCYLDDGNPPYSAIVCDLPIQDLSKPFPLYPQYKIAHVGSCANVRMGPGQGFTLLGTIPLGTIVSVDTFDQFHGYNHYRDRIGKPDAGWVASEYMDLVKAV
jgi:hypothetical protein